MVMRRSFSFSSVFVAMTPGTPQPKHMISGMNALPESPNLRNARSMINATRAMYPLSSRIERNKNNSSI